MTRSVSQRVALILALAALLLPAAAPARKKPKKDEAVVVGKVVDRQEQALAGILVTVTSELTPDFRAEATSDKEGVFTLRIKDPQGPYTFRLEGEGYTPFEGEVQLVPGEEANLGFKLLDAATGRRQDAIKTFNAGVQSFNDEDFAAAKAKFLEALAAEPEMVEAYKGLAEVYYREKNLEEAAAAVEKYLAAQPEDVGGLTLAYTIHRESGNEARTEELIDGLSKTDKAKPLARQIYNEGVAATQKGDNARALERFRRASQLDPELAPAYSSEATMLYNLARYDDALAALDKLFALDAENVQGRRVHYLVYDAMNDQAKVAEALDAYLAADPDGAIEVMYQRADLDFRDGATAKAIAALEKIIELKSDMPRAHYTLGLCYTQSDKAKARAHFQKFLELAPDDPEAATAKEMLSYL